MMQAQLQIAPLEQATTNTNSWEFTVPANLLKPAPSEIRAISRDEVRLMVSQLGRPTSRHLRFKDIGHVLQSGDVLVINKSQTIAAAYDINLPDGSGAGRLHLAPSPITDEYQLEVRRITQQETKRYHGLKKGQILVLPINDRQVKARLILDHPIGNGPIWIAKLLDQGEAILPAQLPVQYDNVKRAYPLTYYQTHLGVQAGSVEMPSAGRAFTANLLEQLKAKGVIIVEVLLHTGLSSPEQGEGPLPEYFAVSQKAAEQLNLAKATKKRIIAVGTTAVRATEAATKADGHIYARSGWTNIHLSRLTPSRICNGLITGFHEPKASHLDLLQSIAPINALKEWYAEALQHAYFWHEFGDLQLILGNQPGH